METNGGVRLVGVQSTPTAAMTTPANTSRRSHADAVCICGRFIVAGRLRRPNRTACLFVIFVILRGLTPETPCVSVPPWLL